MDPAAVGGAGAPPDPLLDPPLVRSIDQVHLDQNKSPIVRCLSPNNELAVGCHDNVQ